MIHVFIITIIIIIKSLIRPTMHNGGTRSVSLCNPQGAPLGIYGPCGAQTHDPLHVRQMCEADYGTTLFACYISDYCNFIIIMIIVYLK